MADKVPAFSPKEKEDGVRQFAVERCRALGASFDALALERGARLRALLYLNGNGGRCRP